LNFYLSDETTTFTNFTVLQLYLTYLLQDLLEI